MPSIENRIAQLEQQTIQSRPQVIVITGADFASAQADWESSHHQPLPNDGHIVFFQQLSGDNK